MELQRGRPIVLPPTPEVIDEFVAKLREWAADLRRFDGDVENRGNVYALRVTVEPVELLRDFQFPPGS